MGENPAEDTNSFYMQKRVAHVGSLNRKRRNDVIVGGSIPVPQAKLAHLGSFPSDACS